MNLKIYILIPLFLLFGRGFTPAQNAGVIADSIYVARVQKCFDRAYDEICAMLDGKQSLSFKHAVFLVENAYFGDSLSYEWFNHMIERYKKITISYSQANRLSNYHFPDSISENLNASLFKIFTDTIFGANNSIISYPFQYNFKDALGYKVYSSVFVSNLFITKKGNCRSLPNLYKILTEELGTKSYLALAPMHMYIKQRNKNIGWYNVELTSGQYPKDAYLISTGYISLDNIRSGLYMDTLSIKESIALCLMDLCNAYQRKLHGSADPYFQLKCADKSLAVKSNLIDGLLKKQVLHKFFWYKNKSENKADLASANKKLYDETNATLIKLDYRDVPQETFEKWYNTYQQNKSKYNNSEINTNFKSTN